MRLFINVGILLILGCIVLAAGKGPTYQITRERQYTFGEKYHISVTGLEQTTTSLSVKGEDLGSETETFDMRLEAVVEVLEINENKNVTKKSITIEKCVQIVNGQEVPLAEKGTVIIATLVNNDDVFTIDEKPVSEELAKAFDIAISPLSGSDKQEDEVKDSFFGTNSPRRVGERWKINADAFAKYFSRGGYALKAKDVSGDTTLKDIMMVNGQQCLPIESQIKIKNLQPISNLPGAKFKSSIGAVNLSCILPVDVTQRPIKIQMSITFEISGTAKMDPDEPSVSIKAKMHREATTQYSAVK